MHREERYGHTGEKEHFPKQEAKVHVFPDKTECHKKKSHPGKNTERNKKAPKLTKPQKLTGREGRNAGDRERSMAHQGDRSVTDFWNLPKCPMRSRWQFLFSPALGHLSQITVSLTRKDFPYLPLLSFPHFMISKETVKPTTRTGEQDGARKSQRHLPCLSLTHPPTPTPRHKRHNLTSQLR